MNTGAGKDRATGRELAGAGNRAWARREVLGANFWEAKETKQARGQGAGGSKRKAVKAKQQKN